MKRYRHYSKKRAIVLACFGSVIEQQKYLDLKEYVKQKFQDCDIFISFSSRMVLKILKKQGQEYKNLPQTLADVDMLGYKHIVVASVNIFPTDEHEYLKKIVDGFKNFSLSNISFTNALLTKTKDTTTFLKTLNKEVSKDGIANLYIIHGTPRLDTPGIDSISYAAAFLEMMREYNFTCSLEGSFPYVDVKDVIKANMKKIDVKKVQIVPLLLVSGNHYIKDMQEIKDDLSEKFEATIVESLTNSENFNLIELPKIREILFENINESIKMMGISPNESTY